MSVCRTFISRFRGAMRSRYSRSEPALLHGETAGQQDDLGQDFRREGRQSGSFEGTDEAKVRG
jgi:hypothetical protein